MSPNQKSYREQLSRLQDVHGEENEDTVWLLSYADLMTLMFTFFVMLYSSVVKDDGETLRKTLSAYMQGSGADNGGQGAGGGSADAIETLKKSMSARIEAEQIMHDVQVEVRNQGLNITFSSNLLFDLGSANLRVDALKPLASVIATLKERAPQMRVRVEGHTDDNPMVRKTGRFRSNWELSGARAAQIASLFEEAGYPAENLMAVGYGSSRPVAPNRTPAGAADPEGQRRNRRVVLTVYEVK